VGRRKTEATDKGDKKWSEAGCESHRTKKGERRERKDFEKDDAIRKGNWLECSGGFAGWEGRY
jgi:hypothetical protein